MKKFSYYKPTTIKDALHISETHNFRVCYLAGGTDLLVRLKNNQLNTTAVIDLKNIGGIGKNILLQEHHLEIGALALLSDIVENKTIRRQFSALREAVSSIGSVQIRNRATLGGNICNASPAADSLPPLYVYNAQVKLVSNDGSREIPIDEFILGPGRTALKKNEFVSLIRLPIPKKNQATSFDRLTRRRGVDLATINICCQVFDSGEVRFSVGAAAPVPFIVSDSSGILMSNAPKIKKLAVIHELMQTASPIDDVRASKIYRQKMLSVLALRTLKQSIELLQNQAKENK